MAGQTALRLEDPLGNVLLLTRIDDMAFTVLSEYVEPPFRMFEDDRAKLRDFLAGSLNG